MCVCVCVCVCVSEEGKHELLLLCYSAYDIRMSGDEGKGSPNQPGTHLPGEVVCSMCM